MYLAQSLPTMNIVHCSLTLGVLRSVQQISKYRELKKKKKVIIQWQEMMTRMTRSDEQRIYCIYAFSIGLENRNSSV